MGGVRHFDRMIDITKRGDRNDWPEYLRLMKLGFDGHLIDARGFHDVAVGQISVRVSAAADDASPVVESALYTLLIRQR